MGQWCRVFTGTALLAVLAPSSAYAQSSGGIAGTPIVLEGIIVETAGSETPVSGSAPPDAPIEGGARGNVLDVEAQQQRFARRPGAETVVPIAQQEPGRLANPSDVLTAVPGVFVTERGAGSSAYISMRGSDIAVEGSRNGRGVRAYLDGFPLGRTEAGLTPQLIDLGTTDFLEVYRGGNSLRYGAIATGGALNFVSKTGLTAPGNQITVSGGSFGHIQTRAEHGGSEGAFDWYLQGSFLQDGGYREHTAEESYRFSGNIGWRPNVNMESRTFFAAGRVDTELAESIPLNELVERGRDVPPNSYLFDERLNFEYERLANRTVLRDGDTAYELGAYVLNTRLDHLPTPFAGIIDYGWLDGGISGRIEHRTNVAGLPTELVAGMRVGNTSGHFDRFQHENGGRDKARPIYDWNFSSWLAESYAEAAVEVLPRVRLFTGLQGAHTTRTLEDDYHGGAVPGRGPTAPGGPQPGRVVGLLEYDREFQALNPKLGVNWEYTAKHFLFANVTRSFETPSGADLSNVLELQGRNPGADIPLIKAQSAWTAEVGARGGWARFGYDLTFYDMRLKNEILTRCATEVSPTCGTTVAFNADSTIHRGIEVGLNAKPSVDVLSTGDSIYANLIWNITDFRFDDDPRFGNARMPVIPEHQIFGEIGYQHASGFFASVNLRYLSERRATYDGSGGDAFVVPDYTLLGAKVGWHQPDKSWSVFLEGRNLTDVAYVSEFSATPTVPVLSGPVPVPAASPQVRPGDGAAVYGGFSMRF